MNLWQEYKEGLALIAKQQAKIIRQNILIRDADKIFETIKTTNLFDQDITIKKWRDKIQKEIAE